MALSKLSAKSLKLAVGRTIAEEKFWPVPAVVLEKAGLGFSDNESAEAMAAWDTCLDIIKYHGVKRDPYNKYELDDAARKACAECGDTGWQRVEGRSVQKCTCRRMIKVECPKLDVRAEWALKQLGGLRRIQQAEVSDIGYIRREFIESFRLAPAVKRLKALTTPQYQQLTTAPQKQIQESNNGKDASVGN